MLRRARTCALAAAALALLSAAGLEVLVRWDAYPIEDLTTRYPDSVRLLDADGQLLREAVNPDGLRARWTPLERLSPLVVAATIAVEDARFYDHPGVDLIGVGRATVDNLTSGRIVSGASTLTMQLARRVHPHPKDLAGKLGEALEALRIERLLDKPQILEQYLNRVYYGAGAVGVEAASQRYFSKPSAHLTVAEAALLAGLPKAPSRLDPLSAPELARARQRHVLRRMLDTGALDQAGYVRALAEPLELRPDTTPLRAGHFTDWLLSAADPAGTTRTTLDPVLQAELEALVADQIAGLGPRGATEAAVVVLDNHGCAVRAMVGSTDFHGERWGAVNGALALRQPGSTLKPFTYALAFERGMTPATVIADVPTRYLGAHDGLRYRPANFDRRHSGPVTIAEALGRSLNVPAVRVAGRLGAAALLDRLRALGFDSLDRPASHYGLGLTLGNGEVSLLELAQGYAALARGGRTCRAHGVAGASPPTGDQALTPEAAFLVTDVLRDERLRMEAFGPSNALMLGFPVAVKTGTSANFRDSWTVGYTDRYTVAVWVGDFAGRSMNHLSGAAGAGPLFHLALVAATAGEPGARQLAARPPQSVSTVTVCALSGQRPTEACPETRAVHTHRLDAHQAPCAFHQQVAIDVRNGLLAGPGCPPEHTRTRLVEALPVAYTEWQAQTRGPWKPTAWSPHCPSTGEVPGRLAVTAPLPGETYLVEPGYDRATQTLRLAAHVDPPVAEVTWLVDGRPVGKAAWPYQLTWPLRRGAHELQVAAAGRVSAPVPVVVR